MCRDNGYEQRLTREGVQWEYLPSVALTEIDEKQSLENQARTEALKKNLVEEYALAMVDGADFPALIAYQNGKKLVLVDGNHRMQAAKQIERPVMDLYLVKTEDKFVLERLTQVWNNGNGERFSPEERLAKAINFLKKYSLSQRDTAKIFGLSEWVFGCAVRDDEVRRALLTEGFNPAKFATHDLRELHQFLTNRIVFRAMAEAKMTHGLDNAQVSHLVRAVKAATSERDQLDAVAQFTDDPQIKKQKARTKGGQYKEGIIRRRMFARYTELINLLREHQSAETLQLFDKEDIDRFARDNATLRRLVEGVIKTVKSVPNSRTEAAS